MPKRSKKIKRSQRKTNKKSSSEVDELSRNIENQSNIVDVEPRAKSEVRRIVELSLFFRLKYSQHWVLRPASVRGVEVAKPKGGR